MSRQQFSHQQALGEKLNIFTSASTQLYETKWLVNGYTQKH